MRCKPPSSLRTADSAEYFGFVVVRIMAVAVTVAAVVTAAGKGAEEKPNQGKQE